MATRGFNQTATYWSPTGSTDKYGKTLFNSPVQLAVRWEKRNEGFRDKHGAEVISKSKVFLQQSVSLDGFLYEGTSSNANPFAVTDAFEIQQIAEVPDLRNLSKMVLAYL